MAVRSKDRPVGFGLDDSKLNWYVFPKEENTIVAYGDKLLLKWHTDVYTKRKMIDVSINDGINWASAYKLGNLYYSLGLPSSGGTFNTVIFNPIKIAKQQFIDERNAKLSAMTDEERKIFLKAERQKKAADRKVLENEAAVKATVELIEIGPKLVNLKDKIEIALKLISSGSIKKPISRYDRKLNELHSAEYLVENLLAHFRKQIK